MVFEVDFPPVMKVRDLSWRPRIDRVDTLRAAIWNLELPADDVDPFAGGDPGGPSGAPTLKYKFKITGVDKDTGAPLVYYDPPRNSNVPGYDAPSISLRPPPNLATGNITLTIELCDCSFCDLDPGSGRCVTRDQTKWPPW